jgi:hypothetical protein
MGSSPFLWRDYEARRGLYHGIMYAGSRTRDEKGRRLPGFDIMRARGKALLRADQAFFEAMRLEKLAEREAIAQSLEDAGRHEEAAIVRARPVPAEWRAP